MAVTVALNVPVVAVLLAVNCRVELPVPGAAMEAGVKLAVTPAGNPETERLTAELNPFEPAVEIVSRPYFPESQKDLLEQHSLKNQAPCRD